MVKPNYTYRGRIERVIDGDTLEVSIDVGFRIVVRTPVRLFGVDAPELSTPTGRDARDYVIGWAQPAEVIIETYPSPEKYGRWLAVIAHDDDRISLNDALVAGGHARRYDGGRRDGAV